MWIKALSKSLLVVVGVFAIVKAIELFTHFVMFLSMGSMERNIPFWVKILSLVTPTALLVTGILLIFKLPGSIKKKICECDDQCEAQLIAPKTVFYVVSVFIGVLLLAWFGPRLVVIVYTFSSASGHFAGSFGTRMLLDTVGSVLQVTAGIYFLLGAPHFVDWQLKKLQADRSSEAEHSSDC